MLNRLRSFDFVLFIIPILLVALSIGLIYSLVYFTDEPYLAFRQGIFVAVGLTGAVIFALIDYRSLRSLWWVFYLLALFLLIYVELFGQVAGGAMRWINIGFFQLQPSEIAKIALIISLASFLSSRVGKLRTRDLIWSALVLLLPLILILKEPDLGTGLVVIFIYLVMLFYSKPSRGQIFVLVVSLLITLTIFSAAVFNLKPFGFLIKQYQRDRIITFLNPEKDPYGQGYNVRQARITLGSGGIFGKGFGQGSQSQLKFLPRPQTDFIFAGVGEAIGFVGSSIVIILYFIMILRILSIGSYARDYFAVLVCAGVAAMFLFQVVVNVGMNLGVMPVTGIPLPLLSSGGTSLVISFITIGIIENVYIRSKKEMALT